MSRTVLIWIGVVIAIIILGGITFYGCDRQNQGGQRSSVLNRTNSSNPCADEVRIAQLEAEVARLNTDLAVSNEKLIACLESQIPVTKTTSTVARSAAPVARTQTTAKAPAPTATTQSIVPPSTGNIKSGTPGTANLDYLRQGGEIIFCVRTNGREDCYFPHYAMNQGVMFSKAPTDNQVKGYNWKVEPTEFYEGDYGVTLDGTFYVSDEMIQKSLQAGGLAFNNQVEIKCPYTGWALKSMTKSGNYWVFATQR